MGRLFVPFRIDPLVYRPVFPLNWPSPRVCRGLWGCAIQGCNPRNPLSVMLVFPPPGNPVFGDKRFGNILSHHDARRLPVATLPGLFREPVAHFLAKVSTPRAPGGRGRF